MTDRELLELAAKAAGYYEALKMPYYADCGLGGFNPLNNDGDALRLAVKLNLVYMPYPNDMAVRITRLDLPEFIEHYGNTNDPYAATRRAIVRAAAEIGRSQP